MTILDPEFSGSLHNVLKKKVFTVFLPPKVKASETATWVLTFFIIHEMYHLKT